MEQIGYKTNVPRDRWVKLDCLSEIVLFDYIKVVTHTQEITGQVWTDEVGALVVTGDYFSVIPCKGGENYFISIKDFILLNINVYGFTPKLPCLD